MAADLNGILYSRFTGEITLFEPNFTPKTKEHTNRIAIYEGLKKDHDWENVAKVLSNFGTLIVTEDHGETYYVFDEEKKMEVILEKMNNLKGYGKRCILKGRHMFR